MKRLLTGYFYRLRVMYWIKKDLIIFRTDLVFIERFRNLSPNLGRRVFKEIFPKILIGDFRVI